jgi:hypothetical protein
MWRLSRATAGAATTSVAAKPSAKAETRFMPKAAPVWFARCIEPDIITFILQ